MPDLPNNPPSGRKSFNDLSTETRLLIAFVLMGVVLFLTPYFYKPPAGPKPVAPAATPTQAAVETTKPPEAAAPAQTVETAPAAGHIGDQAEREFVVDTDLYRIRFSNRGAVVRSWVLKKFLDHTNKPLELVNAASFASVPPPFSVTFADRQDAAALNSALYAAKPTDDNLGIDYEYSDGKNVCRKSFRFGRNSYLSQVTSEVVENGKPTPHLLEWRGGFGDATVLNRAALQHALYYSVPDGKLNTKDFKAAKDGPFTASGNYSFAGLDDTFFAAVFLTRENGSTDVRVFKDDAPIAPNGKAEPHVGAAVGGDAENHFQLFVGPKDIDILRKVDPKLQQVIDWGFFGVIAKPLFLALHFINDNIVHNYGWSIVLITIVINLVLLPLRLTGMKSARKMQALKPQVDAINAKYKDVGLRDPRKAEQNQEIMELYKKGGANPLGGCLPLVFQIPILYAFYKVLTVTIEMRGAHWLWVIDLSQPESLPLHILPIVMIITQFITQRMTPSPGVDPAQQKIMQFMPLMFGFFFYNMSSGLVLYWLTGNLVGIAQQWLINKITPMPVVEPPKPAPKKKKG
jgi:YidC/Oxa1 family membrane protein insertase